VRKGRGDLEGGDNSSEEGERRSGRRRLQQWILRRCSRGRRSTWRGAVAALDSSG